MLQRLCEANMKLLWQPSFDVIIPSLQLTLNRKSSLYLQMIFESHPLALLSSDC